MNRLHSARRSFSAPLRHRLAVALLATTFATQSAVAQDLFDADRFGGFLASGEFAPAERMAGGLPAGEERDRRWAELARAQAGVGARTQADRTAARIRSEAFFAQALGDGDSSFSGGFLGGGSGSGPAGPAGPGGAMGGGGGIQADFDPLMELITSTIAPDSWEELGGTGRLQEFEAGVHVDPTGRLDRVLIEEGVGTLDDAREAARRRSGNTELGRESGSRKVSLTRLEREVRTRLARGQEPTEAMRNLAGLTRIDALYVYPETGELVLVGPAGEWQADREGRTINVATGRPTLQLDDFVDTLRAVREGAGVFGCSIDPRPENLRATQTYLAERTGNDKRWRDGLRAALGTQVITIHGIDPSGHAARSLVAADYHMKLVGMGIEPGVHGVDDVLSLMAAAPERPRDANVIRWWFSLNYDRIVATEARDAFRLEGNAVRVLSENERLNEAGERIGTGTSDDPTRTFAASFSERFDRLCEKYPVYGDLRNVFDLAMVAGLIREHDLDVRVGWNLGCFSGEGIEQVTYRPATHAVPTEVETVMNVKEFRRRDGNRTVRESLLGVSGGVRADIASHLTSIETATDDYGDLDARRQAGEPTEWDARRWWWD